MGPQGRQAPPPQEDPLDDDDKISQRIDVGNILEDYRHVGDGEYQAGEQNGGGQDEGPGHDRLLLGGAGRRNQQAQAHGTEQEGQGADKQHGHAPQKRDLEPEDAHQGYQGHVHQRDEDKRDGLAG